MFQGSTEDTNVVGMTNVCCKGSLSGLIFEITTYMSPTDAPAELFDAVPISPVGCSCRNCANVAFKVNMCNIEPVISSNVMPNMTMQQCIIARESVDIQSIGQ
ncbi:MAG: hypothetical protein WCR46_16350 [Deltaproteobacteria bacterium]